TALLKHTLPTITHPATLTTLNLTPNITHLTQSTDDTDNEEISEITQDTDEEGKDTTHTETKEKAATH
ncbi:hypothetical protein ABTX57_42390, partial [Streptomyces sp. NPDC126522]